MPTGSLLQRSTTLRYIIYMIASFLVTLTTTVGLHEVAGLRKDVSYGIALVVVSFLNFLALRYFVYRSTEGKIHVQFLSFIGSVIGFRIAEWLTFVLVVNVLEFPYVAAVPLIQLISTILKAVVYQRLIFRRSNMRHKDDSAGTPADVPATDPS